MKKAKESSVLARRVAKKEKGIRQRVDFSDIPELSDEQLAVMRRVGRPPLGDEPRKLIAIRLDPKILQWVKTTAARRGRQYQSLINDILAKEMRKAS